jgi:hypothetical protein
MNRFSLRGWLARQDGERGSIPLFLLIAIVGVAITALLVPTIIGQDRQTKFVTSRVQALDAAQAGVDVALGQIRSATDSSGVGDAADLPCGSVSGSVDGAGALTYSVSIKYYSVDPTANPTAAAMLCSPGYGTYDTSTGTYTPGWAQITSVGSDGAAVNGTTKGRTLVTTYSFKTNNSNIPGGVVRIYPSSATSSALCMDAGTATPVAGTGVVLQACSTTSPPAAQQVFVYRTDLTLQLLSSVTSTYLNGLCLSVPSATAGVAVTFAACQTLGSPPYTQQWSFDDWGAFRASLSTSKTNGTLSSVCMNASSQSASTSVTLANCAQDTTSSTQAWIPAPSVGAGAAAAPQWINYYEFGRCIDVTNQDVNHDHLIDYPCKQNPWPSAVTWNQKFTTPTVPTGATHVTGTVYTTTGGTNYCLTSPGTNGGYVIVKPCSASNSLQSWTFYNNDNSLPYSSKFTIVDSNGLCLGLGDPASGEQWSTVDVEKCVGSAQQKWNADPTTPSALSTTEK